MDSLIIYFLPAILALGIITSWEDVKEGKIRNKYIAAAILFSIATHTILILAKLIPAQYALTAFLNLLGALIFAIIIWSAGLWKPGDAKLYAAYITLIPLTIYRHSTANIPIFEILINTITPLFIYLMITLLLKTQTKQKWKALKNAFNVKRIGLTVLAVFSIGWLIQMLFGYLGIVQNYIYNLLAIIILFKIMEKVFKEQTTPLLAITAITRIALQTDYVLRYSFLLEFVVTVAVFVLVVTAISELGESFTKKKHLDELEEGDLLSTKYMIDLKKKGLSLDKTTGLTKDNLKNIKHASKINIIKYTSFTVYQTIPFAPFLFAGSIITILSEGSVFVFIKTIVVG